MQVYSPKPKFWQNNFNLILISLLGILYAPVIVHWYEGWLKKTISTEHEYFSHGLIGIPYAIFIVWSKRKQWQRLPDHFAIAGGFLLIIGAFFYSLGTALFVDLSLPIILAGLSLSLKGKPGFRLLFFPWLLVFLATPNPVPYWLSNATLPLQTFIANVAGFLLMQFGFNVEVDQIYLLVNGKMVEVAPYCAGLKMLFTSLYVVLLLLHWTGEIDNRRKSFILMLGAVLISVTANIIRNTLLAFFHGTGREQWFEWLHEGWAGDLYSTAMLGLIILLLNFLNSLENAHLKDNASQD